MSFSVWGFAASRPALGMLVSHRHVLVNGKKLNIPSYQVKVGDSVTLTTKGGRISAGGYESLGKRELSTTSWLKRKAIVGYDSRRA
jgi:small subunit ribosomal protein S4